MNGIDNIPEQNLQYLKPGEHIYNTPLPPQQEQQFRDWVQQNKVPFDIAVPVSDYDMRGFWLGLQNSDPRAVGGYNLNDGQLHYPDYWKTPYHETFSNESQWALPHAPRWNSVDQLIDNLGNVVFDERAPRKKK